MNEYELTKLARENWERLFPLLAIFLDTRSLRVCRYLYIAAFERGFRKGKAETEKLRGD